MNTATRAFPFEALVPNTDTALKPGTFARVHIESGKVDDVLTLPYAALQYRYGVNRVFVVDGDKLVMRELTVGERLGDRIEVMSGVKAGERRRHHRRRHARRRRAGDRDQVVVVSGFLADTNGTNF